MRKGRRKLNQAGMSLMELIVVILILGILSVGAAVGINYVSQMNATSAGEKLVSLLERVRLQTISAETGTGTDEKITLLLTNEGGTYYGRMMQGTTEIDKVGLGNGSLTVSLSRPGAADLVLADGTSAEISYKKENGAFVDSLAYSSVIISGSKTRTVQLVKATGRSYLK